MSFIGSFSKIDTCLDSIIEISKQINSDLDEIKQKIYLILEILESRENILTVPKEEEETCQN